MTDTTCVAKSCNKDIKPWRISMRDIVYPTYTIWLYSMPRSNRDMVAWCLMILWPKPFVFHVFFCLKRWDTHCGEIDELQHRLRKTKAIQSLLQGGMTWIGEILPDTFYALWLCRQPARQSKWTKRGNEMALTTWAEDEINGRTRIAWLSWNLATIMVLMCQPWRSVSNEGSVSHENICRNWEITWNMVRNLPAELTLEKKFKFFACSYCGIPTLQKV